MASSSATANLKQARDLAQKLFGECRDSSSSFKLLAGSVRKLRNHLEEAEEVFDESRALGPDDQSLLDKVAQSRDILELLNDTLRSYGSATSEDVDGSAVADFKTALDVAELELYLACEAITSNDVQLELDRSAVPDAVSSFKSPSTHRPSTSSSAAGSLLERKSSAASSAWSTATRNSVGKYNASGNLGSQGDDNLERRISEEKEPSHAGRTNPQDIKLNYAVPEQGRSQYWRSPFASLDPLSTSIEQASSMILSGDESFTGTPAWPNASTEQAARDELHFGDIQSKSEWPTKDGAGTPSDAQVSAKSSQQHQVSAKAGFRQRGFSEGRHSLHRRSAEGLAEVELHVSPRLYKARSHESMATTVPREPVLGKETDSLLSPDSARDIFPGSRSTTASITFSVRSVNDGESKDDAKLGRYVAYRPPEGTAASFSSPARDVQFRTAGDEEPTAESATGDSNLNISCERTASSAPDEDFLQDSPQRKDADGAPPPPPPPARLPPQPPKPRRKPKVPKRSSTYRIVNTTTSDNSSSEDEPDLASQSSHDVVSQRSAIFGAVPRTAPLPLTNDSIQEEASDTVYDIGSKMRSMSDNSTYAQRVLSARAAYTPPWSPYVPKTTDQNKSTSALGSRGSMPILSLSEASRESTRPTAQRRSTLTLPPKQPTASADVGDLSTGELDSDQANSSFYHNRSQSDNGAQGPEPSPPRASAANESQEDLKALTEKEVVVTEKEVVLGAGLEVNEQMRPDDGLNVCRSSAPKQKSQDAHESELYVATPLDRERVSRIVENWNERAWDEAERFLTEYLDALEGQQALARARRVRHLLGVCASFQGRWTRAITFFIGVLRAPIADVCQLDDGDCAAAYWLGDCYSLLNRRIHALIAYCIAEHASFFQDAPERRLSDCINAEQDEVQSDMTIEELKVHLEDASTTRSALGGDSILDTDVITTNLAKLLIENEPRKSRKSSMSSGHDVLFQLDQNRARSDSFLHIDQQPHRLRSYHRMKLSTAHFEPNTPWPMMYDPLLAMANVQRGWLLSSDCDLLEVINSNLNAKIPKSGPMNISRMDCFTCTDLAWLITTIRECLKMLEMEFREVATVDRTCFAVQYSFMQKKIATTYYFSIALFRHSFRPTYGAEICPDGICSARIMHFNREYEKGVHQSESKRIKQLIREYLDEAAKQRPKDTSSPKVPQLSDAPTSPALPPRAPPLPPRPF